MTPANPINSNDLLGYGRLGLTSFNGIVDLVESMHATIERRVSPFNLIRDDNTTSGIARLVYRSIRAMPTAMIYGIDAVTPSLNRLAAGDASIVERDTTLAIINGVVGDHLESSGNPLAIPMGFRIKGKTLPLEAAPLAAAVPKANGKILLLIHGLCMNDLQWSWGGHNHGTRLGKDLGYTEVHLHYNTGRHISHNGRQLAAELAVLIENWPVPVEELVIVAHSMGGLVTRSALHYAAQEQQRWPAVLRKAIYLGTPHHGSPLERGGNLLDTIIGFTPFTRPFNRLGQIRSAGITDLRYGNLVDEDWSTADRFEKTGDQRKPVPLPQGIEHFALAADKAEAGDKLACNLLGDGMVPVASALGRHKNPAFRLDFPRENQAVVHQMGHFGLLGKAVYQQVHAWLE